MAWRSSGSTNASLINNLVRNGLITSDRIRKAMADVDRAHYAPRDPYDDSPQSIGYNATISAPHMHAAACESLLPYLTMSTPTRVLDIGSGSGYLTAVLSHLVGERGQVVGIDHIQALVDLAQQNMHKSEVGRAWLANGKVRFLKGDGRLGYTEPHLDQDTTSLTSDEDATREQWDAIHVGAAATEAHETLIAQLKRPGRLFIPVGRDGGTQHIWIIDKLEDGSIRKTKDIGVRYVPLTDEP